MAISSINPTLPNNPERRDRHAIGMEIIKDETIGKAVVDGARKYKALLRQSIAETQDNGEVQHAEKALENIRYLEAFLDLDLVKDLPKQAERMRTTLRGAKEAYIILGEPISRDGKVTKQLEIRAKVEGASSISESELSSSYQGQSPEKIVLQQAASLTPIKTSVVFKDVVYSPEDDAINVLDTTGIAVSMTREGEIYEVQGVTFKHGAPHYTENLAGDIDLANLGKAENIVGSINEFVQ